MKSTRRAVEGVACAALFLAGRAMAQAGSLEIEPPSEPLSCLTSTLPRGAAPAYPVAALAGTGAVVRVKLLFVAPDAAPQPDIFFNNGGEPFAEAVRQHVAAYRLPCLSRGASFKGTQEFQFVSKNRPPAVLESAVRDEDEQDGRWPPECLAGITDVPEPNFPAPSSVTGPTLETVVVARLRFVGPDRPPEVQIVFDGGQRRAADSVVASVSAYRMRCMSATDQPFVATRTFLFRYEGGTPAQLKPELSLAQLVGLVKDMDQYKVRFDFRTMGCPFQISFQPYEPYARNQVRQIGDRHPGRREFLEWLRNVSIDLPLKLQRTALGQSSTVAVPCATLDFS